MVVRVGDAPEVASVRISYQHAFPRPFPCNSCNAFPNALSAHDFDATGVTYFSLAFDGVYAAARAGLINAPFMAYRA